MSGDAWKSDPYFAEKKNNEATKIAKSKSIVFQIQFPWVFALLLHTQIKLV